MRKMITRYGSILVLIIVIGVGTYWAFSANEQTALHTLRDYAEAYDPTPVPGIVVPTLPNLSQEVSEAIQSLHNAQNASYELYVYLIMLKLHRYYVEECNQGFDIRTDGRTIDNPVLREFCHLARIDIQRAEQDEYMSSWMIVDWINIHSYYRSHYPPIRHEMERIETVRKRSEETARQLIEETVRKQIERGDF